MPPTVQNTVYLRGCVVSPPVYSHESHGRPYYLFMLETRRLSGVEDVIRILANKEVLDEYSCRPGDTVTVEGSLRSFNNKSGGGDSKLVITVLARNLCEGISPHENKVILAGTLCKPPVYRRTPLGREICDLILAVGRPYGRADYLPCIAWGAGARQCAECVVGDKLLVEGRIQSRGYIKIIDGNQCNRTAFEVSVGQLEVIEG